MKKTVYSQKVLNVIAGEEYQLKIVDIKNKESIISDFFYNTYQTAYREAEKIITESNCESKELYETANNIIAFCGERGQGKSSAMLSFSKLLKNGNEESVKDSFKDFYEKFSRYKFKVLERMDPTEFENCHSILSVIISRIFNEFQKELKENNYDINKKNNLLDLFQQCYKDIDVIKDANAFDKLNYGYEDDLEELSMLSDSANIKSNFSSLVNNFLDFIYKSKENHFLVIQIDDTDLKVNKAYEIVEDIRKYFMIPNVIVLMAVNPRLLTNAIDQSFQESFRLLITNSGLTVEETASMASRYVNKLIPGSRRIDLPEISKNNSLLDDDTFELRYTDKNKKAIFDYKDINGKDLTDIQDIVLRIIYEKTGIIFIKREDSLHPVISKNTRSLANFLSILNEMPDLYDETDIDGFNDMFKEPSQKNLERIRKRINNIEKFEQYFIDTWIKENVEKSYYKPLEEWKTFTFEEKNKFIAYFLNVNMGVTVPIYKPRYKMRIRATNDIRQDNVDNELTLNNILYKIREMEKDPNNIKTSNSIFAICTLYTIILNKRFCGLIMSEMQGNKKSEYSEELVSFVGKIYNDFFENHLPKNKNFSSVYIHSSLYANAFKKLLSEDKNYQKNLQMVSLFSDKRNSFNYLINREFENDAQIDWYFHVSYPIIRLVQPLAFFSKFITDGDMLKKLKEETVDARIASFQLISNIDLICMMDSILINKRSLSTNTIIPNDFYLNIYKRIQESLTGIKYLKLNNINFNWLINLTKDSAKILDAIHNYNIPLYDEDRELHRLYRKLNTFEKTYTIEELRDRINTTASLFDAIKQEQPALNLNFETKEINNISKTISQKDSLSKKSCLNYQARINKMILSVKETIEYYDEDIGERL